MPNNSNPDNFLRRLDKTLIATIVVVTGGWLFYSSLNQIKLFSPLSAPLSNYHIPPLVMEGGDPYIRALMRTITASEANVSKPYHVLYGGQYISNLDRHPERCITIITGPNKGNCTTAAGRYQFLNVIWADKAKQYHPNPSGQSWWKSYSFQPQYQDEVVYRWLRDTDAWGVDISQQLQEGEIEQVLRLLSGTWTSLGYGIETNSMSSHLPKIYQRMLAEELQIVI